MTGPAMHSVFMASVHLKPSLLSPSPTLVTVPYCLSHPCLNFGFVCHCAIQARPQQEVFPDVSLPMLAISHGHNSS